MPGAAERVKALFIVDQEWKAFGFGPVTCLCHSFPQENAPLCSNQSDEAGHLSSRASIQISSIRKKRLYSFLYWSLWLWEQWGGDISQTAQHPSLTPGSVSVHLSAVELSESGGKTCYPTRRQIFSHTAMLGLLRESLIFHYYFSSIISLWLIALANVKLLGNTSCSRIRNVVLRNYLNSNGYWIDWTSPDTKPIN